MDVTDPSTPEEVVRGVLDDLLSTDEEIDTDVYAENIVLALRSLGFMEDE